MMEKGRISVQGVNHETVSKFKDMVQSKYGKLHTVYGQEVEKALEFYLDYHSSDSPHVGPHTNAHTHTQTDTVYIMSKYEQNVHKVAEMMLSVGAWELEEFNSAIATKYIRQVVGGDQRTIDKYLNGVQLKWDGLST